MAKLLVRWLPLVSALTVVWAGHVAAGEPLSVADQIEPQGVMKLDNLSAEDVVMIAGDLIDAGHFAEARVLLDQLDHDGTGGVERDFLDGMLALALKEFARAEAMFRRILADDPSLVRARLELARTLFLQKKDEEADYHFRLAIATRPEPAVIANIARFREAIRARRAWRVNVNLGIAPDTNINSATNTDRVEILGLPFELSPDAKARSGIGMIAGADASLRLWRETQVPVYLAAYGRMVRYDDQDFNDAYIGGEAGPELRIGGGRLRTLVTGLHRWYGGRSLVTSIGGRVVFEKIINGKLGLEASLALRRNAYARREDVDGWDVMASVAGNRALGKSTLGFAFVSLDRTFAQDPGQSSWQGRLGVGILKEIGWGLRPQVNLEIARQVNDAPLVLFNGTRRDWRFQASASIYKRDWNVAGFAPSIRIHWTRNISALPIYDQKRVRAEFGIAKAF